MQVDVPDLRVFRGVSHSESPERYPHDSYEEGKGRELKMERKKIAAVLLACLLLPALTACGASGSPSAGASGGVSAGDVSAGDSGGAPAESSGDAAVSAGERSGDAAASDGESAGDAGSGEAARGNETAFAGMTVVDNEACSIQITGLNPDGFWGYSLETVLENRSAEKTYMFSVENASVDGVATDPLFAEQVAPGKKANSEISFIDSRLKDNGVTGYTDIELTFRVYDPGDWTAENVTETTVHVYPLGEENVSLFEREPADTDYVVVDNAYVTVIATGYETDGIFGYGVNFYMENRTDMDLMFSADDVSVNGYMLDPFYAKSVAAQKCAFSTMSWSDTSLEETGISEVEEIAFTLRVREDGNLPAGSLIEESVVLNPTS